MAATHPKKNITDKIDKKATLSSLKLYFIFPSLSLFTKTQKPLLDIFMYI